jgi:hypothetical protein
MVEAQRMAAMTVIDLTRIYGRHFGYDLRTQHRNFADAIQRRYGATGSAYELNDKHWNSCLTKLFIELSIQHSWRTIA